MKMSRGCMYRCFHVLQLLKFWGARYLLFFGLTIVNSVWLLLNFNGPGLLFKITFWY